MRNALLLVSVPTMVVVVGVPDCWVDARRLARWLRRAAANDDGHRGLVVPEGE